MAKQIADYALESLESVGSSDLAELMADDVLDAFTESLPKIESMLTRHIGWVAKHHGGYNRIGSRIRPFCATAPSSMEMETLVAAVRAENARQNIVRAARAARRQSDPSIRPLGWSRHEAMNRAWARRSAAERAEREAAEQREQAAEKAVADERRRIFGALRKLGFRRECASGASAYYSRVTDAHKLLTVRVSDHEVPMTSEREWNRDNGGRTWADSRWSFVLGEDADAWLEEVATALRGAECPSTTKRPGYSGDHQSSR